MSEYVTMYTSRTPLRLFLAISQNNGTAANSLITSKEKIEESLSAENITVRCTQEITQDAWTTKRKAFMAKPTEYDQIHTLYTFFF